MHKIYITKYAMTAGILLVDAEYNWETNSFSYTGPSGNLDTVPVESLDWWHSRIMALEDAEIRRNHAIIHGEFLLNSLKDTLQHVDDPVLRSAAEVLGAETRATIERLHAMVFTAPEQPEDDNG